MNYDSDSESENKSSRTRATYSNAGQETAYGQSIAVVDFVVDFVVNVLMGFILRPIGGFLYLFFRNTFKLVFGVLTIFLGFFVAVMPVVGEKGESMMGTGRDMVAESLGGFLAIAVIFTILFVVGSTAHKAIFGGSDLASKVPEIRNESIENSPSANTVQSSSSALVASKSPDQPFRYLDVNIPDNIEVGTPFEVAIGSMNPLNHSMRGTIAISSLSKNIEIHPVGLSLTYYEAGTKLLHGPRSGKKIETVISQYPVVELYENSWEPDVSHMILVKMVAKKPGEYKFLIRATFAEPTKAFKVGLNIPEEGAIDQQGFPCLEQTITVH